MGFESLYIGATGLKAHGTRMNTISNNLANVSTIGFKGSDAVFQNMLSDTVSGGNTSVKGLNQVGQGVSLATIMGDYRQGPIEPGTFATDLAIGGKGYFQVVQGDNVHYTRAGNFRFNSAGFLLDPNGYVLQGQMITDEGTSSTGDLRLDLNENNLVVTEANATSLTTMVMNVNTDVDNTSSAGDPFFALMQSWNGRADPPLTTGAYDYSNAITVYDDQGQSHLLTVYFDGVPSTNANGDRYVEFVVGTDPSQDGRAAFGGTSGAGLLMAGVLTFNSAGQLMDMSAYTRSETASAGSGVLSLESWIPAAMDENGVPLIEARFAAASGATAGVISMGLDMGLTSADGAWQAGYGSNASVVGASTSAMASMSGAQRAALATTAYTGDASTLYQTQDGYGQGVLQSLSTDRNGIISGKFSNGVAKELMQVTLYVFPSEYGLRREGMNHFSETLNSGQAVEGLPDQEQYGALIGTSLEQSNVDMAEQFGDMIITERGFQANSKVISTTDTILQTLINIKR